MVFLLSTEGKKWSLHYHNPQICGKRWEEVLVYVNPNIRRGDYPHCNEGTDILTNPKKWV